VADRKGWKCSLGKTVGSVMQFPEVEDNTGMPSGLQVGWEGFLVLRSGSRDTKCNI
jgi:hypothetical protein